MTVGAERLLSIVAGSMRPSRCRDCRKPIEWAVTDQGRNVALDPNPLVLSYERRSNSVKYHVVSMNSRHVTTCREQKRRDYRSKVFGGLRGFR